MEAIDQARKSIIQDQSARETQAGTAGLCANRQAELGFDQYFFRKNEFDLAPSGSQLPCKPEGMGVFRSTQYTNHALSPCT
jgi:hypothetical protein